MGSVVVRVDVPAEMLAWARQRSGVPYDDLVRRFPKLASWESGESPPTLKQLEKFASATHTPVGFFFLPEPPQVELPVPDFRTRGNLEVRQPSPNLLDTIYESQQRQEWYQDYVRASGGDPLTFVGSFTTATGRIDAAAYMRRALGFEVGQRGSSWSEAFRRLADGAEQLGILVMVSGVVGSNTHRKLDPAEFQGFALADNYAPLVFINGVDTTASQIFTLAHEIAHIWLGQSALDDPVPGNLPHEPSERWCSEVAAELLVPVGVLDDHYRSSSQLTAELDRLARVFRVSTLVILRRIREAGYINLAQFRDAYEAELARVLSMIAVEGPGGGNFYNTQPVRTSKRFARAIISSTLEGQTLYRDACQLLGFKKVSTFNEMAQRLGVT
jgi:Zn-dependent peptidase ImmA (M78 family)